MSCYRPYVGFPDGYTESGKIKYRLRPFQVMPDIDVELKNNDGAITIPCGHCIGCQLDKSLDWAARLSMELKYHDSAYFVTLTYNDDCIPKREFVDQLTGEVCEAQSLCKRDFQLFMKRLRESFPNDAIRFYCAGEYGSTTFRPHYHAIIFGLHLNDLKPYKKSSHGFQYYTSDSLQRVWSVVRNGHLVPLGFAVVADVTFETCAYTARYVTKKLYGKNADFYVRCNIEPPWSLMSRKPGIGRQYLLDHHDSIANDSIVLSQGKKVKNPRYFMRILELTDNDLFAKIKEARKTVSENSFEIELSNTGLNHSEYLDVKENVKRDSIMALRRSAI